MSSNPIVIFPSHPLQANLYSYDLLAVCVCVCVCLCVCVLNMGEGCGVWGCGFPRPLLPMTTCDFPLMEWVTLLELDPCCGPFYLRLFYNISLHLHATQPSYSCRRSLMDARRAVPSHLFVFKPFARVKRVEPTQG